MELLVDIGNTSFRWSTVAGLADGAVSSQQHLGELTPLLDAQWRQLAAPAAVWVSCVAGEAVRCELRDWCTKHWGLKPDFLRAQAAQGGVKSGYRQPETLGVDRFLALQAAKSLSVTPVIVVDCGTATTIDALGRDGTHHGGLILPGLEMAAQALIRGTDIPPPSSLEVDGLFGADSGSGIAAGALFSTVALIERAYAELEARSGETPRCLLTGGGALRVREWIRITTRYEPHLVLMGIVIATDRSSR